MSGQKNFPAPSMRFSLVCLFLVAASFASSEIVVFSNPFSDLWWVDWQPPSCVPRQGIMSHNQAQFFECAPLSGNDTFFFEEAVENFPWLFVYACPIESGKKSYNISDCQRLNRKTQCLGNGRGEPAPLPLLKGA